MNSQNPLIVSILSGKGGVGKSVISFNLAERMADSGSKVLLVDADFSSGNAHILANKACTFGIGHFISGHLSLRQATTMIDSNLHLLASTWQNDDIDVTDTAASAGFIRNLRQQADNYDLVIIDHSSGISKAATIIAHGSDISVLVIVPELTSICDGYGLFKRLTKAGRSIDCRLLVNRASNESEVNHIHSKFAAMAERFVGKVPHQLGYLLEDDNYRKSVAAQQPVASIETDSAAAQQLTRLGRMLFSQTAQASAKSGLIHQIEINNRPATADIKG